MVGREPVEVLRIWKWIWNGCGSNELIRQMWSRGAAGYVGLNAGGMVLRWMGNGVRMKVPPSRLMEKWLICCRPWSVKPRVDGEMVRELGPWTVEMGGVAAVEDGMEERSGGDLA